MQYLRVSDIIEELSVARQDDDREEWLRYIILSKSVLRDLKVQYINDFKRVYLPIDAKTFTVRIPFDTMRIRTISIIEECRDRFGRCTEKVIPLTYNPYINITPVPKTVGCPVCGCDATHPVCVELGAYTTLCEDVMIDPSADPPLVGTKQTVLKTCPNGDIIKEVSQPTQKFIKGVQQCDYAIEVVNFDGSVIEFPYTIESITINNVTQTESPPVTVTTQDELDAFFTDLGFTKVDNTHYSKTSSTDVYFSLAITTDASPAQDITINFAQSNCTYPLISDGISNAVTTDVLCNVEVTKCCGNIVETPANIEKIVTCCAPFLNCCQQGELTNWDGWNIVPSCCVTNSPQPYNRKGTYNLDLENFIIYLDSTNATKVLLAYDTDGSCQGDYAIPDFMLEAFKAGIAFRHAQYNEEISPVRRRELKMNFNEELNHVDKIYLDPIRMADLIGALKTHHTPY